MNRFSEISARDTHYLDSLLFAEDQIPLLRRVVDEVITTYACEYHFSCYKSFGAATTINIFNPEFNNTLSIMAWKTNTDVETIHYKDFVKIVERKGDIAQERAFIVRKDLAQVGKSILSLNHGSQHILYAILSLGIQQLKLTIKWTY